MEGFEGQETLYENKNYGESKGIYDNCKKKVSDGSQKVFSQTEETKVINKKLSSKEVKFIITSERKEEKVQKKRSPKKPKILFKVIKIEEKTQINFIKAENKRKRSKTSNKPKSRLVLFKVEKKKGKKKKLKEKNDINNIGLTTEAALSEIFDNAGLLNEENDYFDLYPDDILREEDLDILAGIRSNHQRNEPRPERRGLNLGTETKPFTVILKEIK